MRRALVAALVISTAVFVACGGGGGDDATAGAEDPGDHAHDHAAGAQEEGSVPGAPADASEATRRVEVAALDQLRFDPASIEVSAGEAVTFVVTNEGNTEHEFVLGDAEYQKAHGRDMDHDMSMGNAVTVEAGQTEELTWRFDESGEVLYGCHVNGHYDGGMVGTIEVD